MSDKNFVDKAAISQLAMNFWTSRVQDSTPLPEYKEFPIKTEETFLLGMQEICFTNPKSPKPVVANFGIGPCLGIILRDPKSGNSAVAHLGEKYNAVFAVSDMIKTLEDHGATWIEAILIGGLKMSAEMVNDVTEFLIRKKTVTIISSDLLRSDHPQQFAYDSRDVSITTNFNIKDHRDETLSSRMDRLDKDRNMKVAYCDLVKSPTTSFAVEIIEQIIGSKNYYNGPNK